MRKVIQVLVSIIIFAVVITLLYDALYGDGNTIKNVFELLKRLMLKCVDFLEQLSKKLTPFRFNPGVEPSHRLNIDGDTVKNVVNDNISKFGK